MTKKEIEELIKFVSRSAVSEVSMEIKDLKITIKNAPKFKEVPTVIQAPAPAAPPPNAIAAPHPTPAPAAPIQQEPPKAKTESAESHHELKSPMIGTFYRASSPDKPNFVNVGDEVKAGQVICIIEAMKLFNEIECDVTGKVVKILVDNATPVEYDQPLILIEPS